MAQYRGMDTLREWTAFLSDLFDWVAAVLKNSGATFLGIFFTAIVAVYEHYKGEAIPWKPFLWIIAACVFWSFFTSWRTEHHLVGDYRAAIDAIGIPCFEHTQITRARLFSLNEQLGMLACLHVVNIGKPSRVGRWEVSGRSRGVETAGVISPIPDEIRRSVLKSARSFNDFATAESRAAIGSLHPLGTGIGRFRPGDGLLWALFESDNIDPSTIRISFVDEAEKRYSINPSPALARAMRNEQNSREQL